MEDRDFQLNGTNEEKAKQLADRLKQGRISKETLDAILPREKEFFKCLVDSFRAQLDTDSNDYNTYSETISSFLSTLSSVISNEDLDSETRNRIIDLVFQINKDYQDKKKKKIKESKNTKWGILAIGVAGLLLIGYGIVKGRNNNK